jgi:hypothetical protein
MTDPIANPVATETQNPEPQPFTISRDGAALRAELDKASGKPTDVTAPKGIEKLTEVERRTRALTIKDADGGEVNLETGEQTIAPPAETSSDYDIIPELELLPPDPVFHEGAQQLAVDLEALGQDKGYPRELMQTAMDAGADLFMSGERDLAISSPTQCTGVLLNKYGPEDSAKLIDQAQKQARSMGPATMKWLDESGVGNSPAAIAILAAAFRGDLQMKPEDAKATIARLRAAPEANTKLSIDRVRILARVANPKGKPQPEAVQNLRALNSLGGDDVMIGGPETAAELRKQLDELQKPGSDLYISDGPIRAKAIKKRMALQRALAARGGA